MTMYFLHEHSISSIDPTKILSMVRMAKKEVGVVVEVVFGTVSRTQEYMKTGRSYINEVEIPINTG